VSEPLEFRGQGPVPGGCAHFACDGVGRGTAELLLASWFAWLGDRAAVTIAPAGESVAAELRIRRWKSRADLVLFRWRNADETRESFARVREWFEADRNAFELELTPRTKQPRALAVALAAEDVFTPAAAVGLANRAFAAAGLRPPRRYDLTCTGDVLREGTRPVALVPQDPAYEAGRSIGRALGGGVRWAQRTRRWMRGNE
jgi:hypothetical protein